TVGSAEGSVDSLTAWPCQGCAGRMLTMPKKYSDEFKRDAVAMVNSGMAQHQVCKDMGISRSSLQNWVQKDRMTSRGIPVPEDNQERKEVARALKRVRELEMENE